HDTVPERRVVGGVDHLTGDGRQQPRRGGAVPRADVDPGVEARRVPVRRPDRPARAELVPHAAGVGLAVRPECAHGCTSVSVLTVAIQATYDSFMVITRAR